MAVTYFGRNDNGDDSGYTVGNEYFAGRFQNTAGTGNVTEMGFNCGYSWGGSVTVRLGIYEDNSGAVGDLLADAGTVTVTTTGWFNLTGLSIPVVADTYYWLAAIGNSDAKLALLLNGGTNVGNTKADTYGPMDDPYPVSGSTYRTWSPCLRAGVETSGLSVGGHRSTTILGNW